ncbi:MAG: hypothetical protein ABI333_10870 [bacterium]
MLPAGTEDGPCLPDTTCNLGLICHNQLCVTPSRACGAMICTNDEFCNQGSCTDRWVCMDQTDPSYLGWPDDSDLEPNDTPTEAQVFPCGDDAVVTNPMEYAARCPSRESYTNGYMNLVICPIGEVDLYAMYLLDGESVTFQLLYQWSTVLPRDLDARILRIDGSTGSLVEVTVGASTNDNETLTVQVGAGTGNPPGWYYIEVAGKTAADHNYYTISYTLNGGVIAR